MTLEQAKEIVEEIQAGTKTRAYSFKIVKDSRIFLTVSSAACRIGI